MRGVQRWRIRWKTLYCPPLLLFQVTELLPLTLLPLPTFCQILYTFPYSFLFPFVISFFFNSTSCSFLFIFYFLFFRICSLFHSCSFNPSLYYSKIKCIISFCISTHITSVPFSSTNKHIYVSLVLKDSVISILSSMF